MAYIEQIISIVETLSPPRYSQLWQQADGSYDNTGLILGGSGETGTVLVWKKDQVFSPAAEQFLKEIKNAD